ncbi:hypothetical protein BT96DRAFT_947586 [Gymnopus androsaceus JB14]|uniref:Uncharacterized protein n=1 Tax=Gymnopus androsaceus JB14 TaxID=1447944 RepID=A0A6A4GRT7_9AGAR|nr:hypothetical protein BT96DRAFT_947586 [Gymnopus androsaceus JB14]
MDQAAETFSDFLDIYPAMRQFYMNGEQDPALFDSTNTIESSERLLPLDESFSQSANTSNPSFEKDNKNVLAVQLDHTVWSGTTDDEIVTTSSGYGFRNNEIGPGLSTPHSQTLSSSPKTIFATPYQDIPYTAAVDNDPSGTRDQAHIFRYRNANGERSGSEVWRTRDMAHDASFSAARSSRADTTVEPDPTARYNNRSQASAHPIIPNGRLSSGLPTNEPSTNHGVVARYADAKRVPINAAAATKPDASLLSKVEVAPLFQYSLQDPDWNSNLEDGEDRMGMGNRQPYDDREIRSSFDPKLGERGEMYSPLHALPPNHQQQHQSYPHPHQPHVFNQLWPQYPHNFLYNAFNFNFTNPHSHPEPFFFVGGRIASHVDVEAPSMTDFQSQALNLPDAEQGPWHPTQQRSAHSGGSMSSQSGLGKRRRTDQPEVSSQRRRRGGSKKLANKAEKVIPLRAICRLKRNGTEEDCSEEMDASSVEEHLAGHLIRGSNGKYRCGWSDEGPDGLVRCQEESEFEKKDILRHLNRHHRLLAYRCPHHENNSVEWHWDAHLKQLCRQTYSNIIRLQHCCEHPKFELQAFQFWSIYRSSLVSRSHVTGLLEAKLEAVGKK